MGSAMEYGCRWLAGGGKDRLDDQQAVRALPALALSVQHGPGKLSKNPRRMSLSAVVIY